MSGLLVLVLAAAAPAADVCLTIDEGRDTLGPKDRAAALLLLARQFELAGAHVVAAGCPASYVVSHVQLGNTITVTLAGPNGQRDAVALGIDDIPAVYSQMVRSLLTGRPMEARGIVDRTNVSSVQAAAPRRVQSDSVLYARLGYGGVFGDRAYAGPSVGVIGYRRELNAFAIDVSFLNFQYKPFQSSADAASGMTGSWLKLEALHFTTPSSDRSLYMGGGLSWNTTNLDNREKFWRGSGLQGELTAGYEMGRASTIRVFVQADAGLPFYRLTSQTYTYWYPPSYPYRQNVTTEQRYAPSLTLSIGFGWQRGSRK